MRSTSAPVGSASPFSRPARQPVEVSASVALPESPGGLAERVRANGRAVSIAHRDAQGAGQIRRRCPSPSRAEGGGLEHGYVVAAVIERPSSSPYACRPAVPTRAQISNIVPVSSPAPGAPVLDAEGEGRGAIGSTRLPEALHQNGHEWRRIRVVATSCEAANPIKPEVISAGRNPYRQWREAVRRYANDRGCRRSARR